MLSLFICEDDPAQRKKIEDVIKHYLLMKDYPLELVLSSENPIEILNYLKSSRAITGLYFLDVNLNTSMTGIELAYQIRKYDTHGKIVFITTHEEFLPLIFSYKIEALDYIIKDTSTNTKKKIQDCIEIAFERYLNSSNKENFFQVKIGTQVRYIDVRDILFFETTTIPHKLKVNLMNGTFDFYSSIKQLDKEHPSFFRCHKSFVVNRQNIQRIDSKKRKITMNNEQICPISLNGLRKLKKSKYSLT